MDLLIAGIAVFMLTHLIPSAVPLKAALVAKLSFNGYKVFFSVLSLIGLVLIVIGKAQAPFTAVFDPPSWGRHATMLLVLLAFILLAAANMPTNIKRLTRHPMMWGVLFWALGHLLANGDLASVILFGSFGAFALVDMLSENLRGAAKQAQPVPVKKDIMVVVAGIFAYAVLLFLHPWLFGYPVI